MSENLQELFANLPAYLGGHLLLSLTALAAAVTISLPLGLVASRRPKLANALAVQARCRRSQASAAAMMVLPRWLIGFWPAFLASSCTAFCQSSRTRSSASRCRSGAAEARGLGMSDRQMLWRVELPLAAPVILGIRTATVLVVALQRLATPVGGLSLGNYFAGIATLNHTSTLFGCGAALLAIRLDQLVRLLNCARRHSQQLACVVSLEYCHSRRAMNRSRWTGRKALW